MGESKKTMCPHFCVSLIALEPLGYSLEITSILGLEGVNTSK